MTPYEILLSETQERMLLVARAGREREVQRDLRGWDLEAVVIGRVTDDGRMRVRWHGEAVVDIPVDAGRAPEPRARPAGARARRSARAREARPGGLRPRPTSRGALLAARLARTSARSAWIYRQYDQLVRGNTVSARAATPRWCASSARMARLRDRRSR